jgi:K+-transporting ATPase ATPase C chain
MKKEFLPSLILSVLCIGLTSVLYPLLMLAIALLAPGGGTGFTIESKGKQYYLNIAQEYTGDQYFKCRPSAAAYNAAGSAGSNKGPDNPDYLAAVQERIDSFVAHNPTVRRQDISADMVTASGSGLDPDISPQGAMIQVARVATARKLSPATVSRLVSSYTRKPLIGLFGPEKVNVLTLNIALDNLKQ